jgi:hypothetical protein
VGPTGLRDCLSGEVLLARSLVGATEADRAALLREVRDTLTVPIRGVISDGQQSIRKAVAAALPDLPHQLGPFHYLREAAKPIYQADRHAKKEFKKLVRGVRPLERPREARQDPEAEAIRGDGLAVAELEAIPASLGRVLETGEGPPASGASSSS